MKRILAIVSAVFFMGLTATVHAQEGGNSITVSPALADVEINIGEAERKVTFTISNSYNVPVRLSVALEGIDEQSGKLLPNGQPAELLTNAVLSDTLIEIPEQSSRVVTLLITNNDLLAPGGHYGALVFTQESVGDSEVQIKQSISAGVFVVKRGGQIRAVELTKNELNLLPTQMPKSADISLKNIGNVHVTPRASIFIYAGSKLVAKGVYNSESKRILPQGTYEETVSITPLVRLWLPTKLSIVTQYRADTIEEFQTETVEKWYIPAYLCGAVVFVFFGMFLLIAKISKKRKKKPKAPKIVVDIRTEPEIEDVAVEQKVEPKRKKKSKKVIVKTDENTLEP